MSKQAEKTKKPLVLSKQPSANWRIFINECRNNGEISKKTNILRKVNRTVMAERDYSNTKLYKRLPSALAIDCEMVGVSSSQKDMLARVSIVDMEGKCVYDKFVKPTEKVVDYRTWVSGVRAKDLKKGELYQVVREEVAKIIQNKIVVGHSVSNDFRALNIQHPRHLIRDTAYFPVFTEMFDNKTPSLRNLARIVLGVNIQCGEHSSVEDARATIHLYRTYRREWEEYLQSKEMKRRRHKSLGKAAQNAHKEEVLD